MNIQEIDIPEKFGALSICSVQEKQTEHETAHELLHYAVKRYTSRKKIILNENLLTLNYTAYRKPYFQHYPEIRFNLSHSGGLAVCLLSERECGVDVEFIRKIRPAVVRKVFTLEEQRFLQTAEFPEEAFTALWTLKESYVKAIGKGISFRMNEVAFRMKDNEIFCNQKGEFFRIKKENYWISLCILPE